MYSDVLYLFTHTLRHVQWMLFIGCTFMDVPICMHLLYGDVSVIPVDQGIVI